MEAPLPYSLSGLISTLGEPKFAQELMVALRMATGADLISAFEFSETEEPVYLFGAGCSPPEARFSQTAGIKYANGYWRFDPAVSHALSTESCTPRTIFRQKWHDISNREYRAYCYESHDVLERVSIFDRSRRTPILLNLYRYKDSGHFSTVGVRRIEQSGGVLGALVAKHAELAAAVQRWKSQANFGEAAKFLRNPALGLSTQEIEVCASLLAGFSYKEIAQRRSLKISSVITYRKRAFLKLGIRNRGELEAIFESSSRRARPLEFHQ